MQQINDEANISTLQTASSANTALIGTKQNTIDVSNKLLSSNVDYTLSPIQFVDISSPLQANLSSINNVLAGNATSLSTINTNLTILLNADVQHDTQITTLNNAVASINSSKQNNITLTNKLDSSLVNISSLNSDLSTIITQIDNELITLSSNKQDLISSKIKFKVPISIIPIAQ